MQLLVSDANIFIDLEEGGILDEFFELDVNVIVPDVLYREELNARHSDLLDRGLEQQTLSGTAVRRVLSWGAQYPRASRNDLMALSLTVQEACMLLTGDSALRDAAEAEQVEVHGTLWIAEQLVEASLLAPEELCEAYLAMKRADRRLPWGLVRDQLEGWGCKPPEGL